MRQLIHWHELMLPQHIYGLLKHTTTWIPASHTVPSPRYIL